MLPGSASSVTPRFEGSRRGSGCKDEVVTTSSSMFDIERRRHLQGYAGRLQVEAERLTWPLERLHALRDERLRALVRTAKERSKWHARRLAHVDPATLTGDDLSMIPVMTKADVMANWDDIVTDRRLTLERAEAHLSRGRIRGSGVLARGLSGAHHWGVEREAWRLRLGLRRVPHVRPRSRPGNAVAAAARWTHGKQAGGRRCLACDPRYVSARSDLCRLAPARSDSFVPGHTAATADRRWAQRIRTNGSHELHLDAATPG